MKITLLAFGMFFFLLFTMSLAQEDVEVCMDCHSDKELTSEKDGIEYSVHVDLQIFNNSVHEVISCTDCHLDVDPDDLPHEESLAKVNCAECHDTEIFNESVHGNGKVACNECHGEHNIQFSDSLKPIFDDLCLSCHSSAASDFNQSIHSSITLEGNEELGCTSCHSQSIHTLESGKFAEESLHQICQSCHKEEVQKFEGSLHGKALTHGKFLAPNCITCHNAHQIKISKDNCKST